MKPSPDQQPRSKNISGPRIRLARIEFKPPLTQDQLAGRLAADGIQLDRVAITKIETGTRGVMDFELRGIARALKTDVNWLLGISGPSRALANPNGKESK
jgi:hypothetical protein